MIDSESSEGAEQGSESGSEEESVSSYSALPALHKLARP